MDVDRHGPESDPGGDAHLVARGRHVLRSYDLGANAYVRKPMIYHDLVESIKQVGYLLDTVDRSPGGEGWRR